MNIRSFIKIFFEFLYPSNIKCIICNNPISKENTYSLCKDCFLSLNFIKDGCFKCGKPIVNTYSENEKFFECSFCETKKFYFTRAISCIQYNEISKKIVFNLKYKSQTYIGKYISKIMVEKLELEDIIFDYIVYVPIHKTKIRKRGFNQSKIIANELSDLINKEILECIERKCKTKKLSGLNVIERKKELKNAFIENKNIEKIYDKNILLVDDIFTTGSTANEISRILKNNGCKNIYLLSFLTGRI